MHLFYRSKILLLFTSYFLLFALKLKAQEPRLMLPEGHTDQIRWTDITADSKYILSYGAGPNIFIWETATGKLVKKLQAELSSYVTGAKFSPSGKYIVTISNSFQDNFKVWDIQRGTIISTQNYSYTGSYFFGKKDYLVSYSYSYSDSVTVLNLASRNKHRFLHGIPIIVGTELFFYENNILKRWDYETDHPLTNYAIRTDSLFKDGAYRSTDGRPLYLEIIGQFLVHHRKTGDEVYQLQTGQEITSPSVKKEVLAKLTPQKYLASFENGLFNFKNLKTDQSYQHKPLEDVKYNEGPMVFRDHYIDYTFDNRDSTNSKTTIKSINIISGKTAWEATFPYDLYFINLRNSTIFCYSSNSKGPNCYFLLDVNTGKKIRDFPGVVTAQNEKLMVLLNGSNEGISVADRNTLKIISHIESKKAKPPGLFFVNDSLLFNGQKLFDIKTLKIKYFFPGSYEDTDLQHRVVIMRQPGKQNFIFSLETGLKTGSFEGQISEIFDNGMLVTNNDDTEVSWVYNYLTGELLQQINGTLERALQGKIYSKSLNWAYQKTHDFAFFSLNDENTAVYYFTANKLVSYKGAYHKVDIDSKYLMTTDSTSTYVYELDGGKLIESEEKLHNLDPKFEKIANWDFPFPDKATLKQMLLSYDRKHIMAIYNGDSIIIKSIDNSYASKKIKINLLPDESTFFGNKLNSFLISKDQKLLYTADLDYQYVYNLETGESVKLDRPYNEEVTAASFSQNNQFMITKSFISSAEGTTFISLISDIKTGKIVQRISNVDRLSTNVVNNSATFYAENNNNILQVFDANNGKIKFQYIDVDSVNYLITDQYGRYDGTENARKTLYFTCGLEIIDLVQVKDELWVPNLLQRIMKGETINAKKLTDLNICGLTPEVTPIENNKDYHFKITPRKGGLGETVLYINDIEVKRYLPSQLLKNGISYELKIPKVSLVPFFTAGKDNPVTVKAYTAKNDISSRGAKLINQQSTAAKGSPNLYAVIVGVSDYKGVELDLKYAAKDANDISNALASAARKLLNTDDKEHVFIYNLNTTKNATFPEKTSIKNAIADVGKKANANDIFLVFFAGHGVMEGTKKQFYFLTADASRETVVSQVGISTDELSEWMKPANIRAQKRILIFDACNSGQALNELVKIGSTNQQYLAARNDDRSQQIKTIEKLNEKSGLFILSASASNQSAYEMGKYSQGLLTYALLKTMKEQPDILDDSKYLNVGKWFNAAEKTVSDLVRESGNRQEPQVVSTSNFNIGIIDQEVMEKIILPQENILFTNSNFQNSDEAIVGDDLELNKAITAAFLKINAGADSKNISFIAGSNSPAAYTLNGRYDVKGENVTVRLNIWQNKVSKQHLKVNGKKDKVAALAEEIVKQVANWASKITNEP